MDVDLENYLMECLTTFRIDNKMCCITAENASTNRAMAREISIKLGLFQKNHCLFGCVSHFINVVAYDGLAISSKKLGETSVVVIADILKSESFDKTDYLGALTPLMGFITESMKTSSSRKSFEKLVESQLGHNLGPISNFLEFGSQFNQKISSAKRHH